MNKFVIVCGPDKLNLLLTPLRRDKMAAISQTILSYALPSMKIFIFW